MGVPCDSRELGWDNIRNCVSALKTPTLDSTVAQRDAEIHNYAGTRLPNTAKAVLQLGDSAAQRSFAFYRICGNSGAFSPSHADAEGSIAISEVRNGQKLWSVQDNMDPNVWWLNILESGSVILMPPGQKHAVYTVNASICAGGHIYSGHPDVLRQTLRAREENARNLISNQHEPVALHMLQDWV